jgi:hypothetical protein
MKIFIEEVTYKGSSHDLKLAIIRSISRKNFWVGKPQGSVPKFHKRTQITLIPICLQDVLSIAQKLWPAEESTKMITNRMKKNTFGDVPIQTLGLIRVINVPFNRTWGT